MLYIFSITPLGFFFNRPTLTKDSFSFIHFHKINATKNQKQNKDFPKYPDCHMSDIHIIRLMHSKLDNN
uniref:Uncharacterized protein n=1 Tax=viral metagenome TaxID=1070528 RepID=A0A6C0KZ41_9ZZZZ